MSHINRPTLTRSRTIERAIEIDAPPAAVWAVLTATDAYAEWNPFITRLDGELAPGARVDVRIAPPGARPMSFRPVVLAAIAERELRWLGRFVMPGLFDGEHSFHIEPLGGGRSRFIQAERFNGVFVGAFRRTLDKTELGFEQMNIALKRTAEALGAAPYAPATERDQLLQAALTVQPGTPS